MQPTPGFRGTVRYLGFVCPVTDSTHEPNTVQVQVHGVQTRVPWDKVEVVEDYEVRDETIRKSFSGISTSVKMLKSVGQLHIESVNVTSPTTVELRGVKRYDLSKPTWSLDGPQSPDDILYPNLFGKR